MPTGNLKRKTFYVDEDALHRAQKALGVHTASEAIRTSLKRVTEMEEFWKFMKNSRKLLKPGSVEIP